jgi:hypothetical protein
VSCCISADRVFQAQRRSANTVSPPVGGMMRADRMEVQVGTGLRNCPNASVPYRAGTVYPRRGEFPLGVDITDIGKIWAARSVVRVIMDASFEVVEALGIGDLLGVIDALIRQHQYTMFVKRGLMNALVACAYGIS